MAARTRFDPKRDYVVARGFVYQGVDFEVGDPFPPTDGSLSVTRPHLERQYGMRAINMKPLDQAPPDPVSVEEQPGGYYLISAAWLDEPVKVRGKAKAAEEADRIRDAGPPLGWIEGGTQVTVEGGEGGWYDVAAPWLAEPEKVQGREAAEARQREIHQEGEPQTYDGVTLSGGENSWFEVKADWLPDAEKIQGEQKARDRAAELRAEGPPPAPAFDNTADVSVTEEDGKFVVRAAWLADSETFEDEQVANDRATALLAEDQAEQERVTALAGEVQEVPEPAASVLVSVGDDNWTVTAPWLDAPEDFDTAEKAEARQAELRDAGPPEGWEPAAPE